MKTKMNLAVVICLVLGMMLSALPAAAGTKTEVSGTLEDWVAPDNPDYRDWISGNVYHWRNEALALHVASSDPRITGYDLTMSNNGDIFFVGNGKHLIHIYSQGTIYAEPDFVTPLWACLANGWVDAEGNFTSIWECHGIGDNAGLVAHLDITTPEGVMTFDGEILAP